MSTAMGGQMLGGNGPPGPLAASVADVASAAVYPKNAGKWLFGTLLCVQSVTGFAGPVFYYWHPTSTATVDGIYTLLASTGGSPGRLLFYKGTPGRQNIAAALTGALPVGQTLIDLDTTAGVVPLTFPVPPFDNYEIEISDGALQWATHIPTFTANTGWKIMNPNGSTRGSPGTLSSVAGTVDCALAGSTIRFRALMGRTTWFVIY